MKNSSPKCRLLELRKKYNLTQDQLANEVGMSTTTISNIENSDKPLRIDLALEIADRYKVSLDWLYGLQDTDKKSDVLDSFSSFFRLGQLTIPVKNATVHSETSFLTLRLSSVVTAYLLEMNDIERINKEKYLPEPAYKAWRESVKAKYLEELEEKGVGEAAEFVLIMNDEHFGSDLAYCRARRELPELAARTDLDKMNFDNE